MKDIFTQKDAEEYLKKYTSLSIPLIIQSGTTTRKAKQIVIDAVYFESIRNSEAEAIATQMLRDSIEEYAPKTFSEAMMLLSTTKVKPNSEVTHIDPKIKELIDVFGHELDKVCASNWVQNVSYNGLRMMMGKYMRDVEGIHMETPEFMRMRVASRQAPHDLANIPFGMFAGIYDGLPESQNEAKEMLLLCIKESYMLQSLGFFTHATPTLVNCWANMPQLASCFLIDMKADSMAGIFDTFKDVAMISKNMGGIGLALHKLRSNGAQVASTNGTTKGLMSWLLILNEISKGVDQTDFRPGSFAMYLEPWHPDFITFLEIRANKGDANLRARKLHHAIWMNDLFMERVEKNEMWSTFCPDECPHLDKVWGDDFRKLYEKYEREGKAKWQRPAVKIFEKIVKTQIETGEPFIVSKDASNRKSNQQNRGTIKSSNLCTEILEYTAPDEIAVCNLASIALPRFIEGRSDFDFDSLHKVVEKVTGYLDNLIDATNYPAAECKTSNDRMRPLGIGVQGLADVYIRLGMSWGDEKAIELGSLIFETIYHAFLVSSHARAKALGPYPFFDGSPASKGILQFDMWNFKPSDRYDWDDLRVKIMKDGLRNSQGIAPMPTASTSTILNNTEAFQPITAIAAVRRAMIGDLIEVNRDLLNDLETIGLDSNNMLDKLKASKNSVQDIAEIPDEIKRRYRTAYEIPESEILEHLKVMAPFVDQSMSRNIHFVWDDGSGQPLRNRIASSHMASWKAGLKTWAYYTHKREEVVAPKFTVRESSEEKTSDMIEEEELSFCPIEGGGCCDS